MNRSCLPPAAFIDPRGVNREEIQRLTHQVLDLLLAYLTEATTRSPLPVGSVQGADIPMGSIAEEDLLEKLRPIIAHSMNNANPGFMGHMNSMPTTMSIVGDHRFSPK